MEASNKSCECPQEKAGIALFFDSHEAVGTWEQEESDF